MSAFEVMAVVWLLGLTVIQALQILAVGRLKIQIDQVRGALLAVAVQTDYNVATLAKAIGMDIAASLSDEAGKPPAGNTNLN